MLFYGTEACSQNFFHFDYSVLRLVLAEEILTFLWFKMPWLDFWQKNLQHRSRKTIRNLIFELWHLFFDRKSGCYTFYFTIDENRLFKLPFGFDRFSILKFFLPDCWNWHWILTFNTFQMGKKSNDVVVWLNILGVKLVNG